MGEAIARRPSPGRDDDQRIVIPGVRWDRYCAMRAALDDVAGLRMTYLDGMLEIVTPGRSHETIKKLFARLVETFALERSIKLNAYGSMTFSNENEGGRSSRTSVTRSVR